MRISLFSIVATTATTAAYTAPAQPQTRVETDQKTGAVLFIVNGREQARIDGAGLHVRDAVEYGGTIANIGRLSYDDQAKRSPCEIRPLSPSAFSL